MRYPVSLKWIHLALAILCLAAWGSAQFAGDYKRALHVGFSVHEFIGIAFTFALAVRVLAGLLGPRKARFATWLPLAAGNRRLIADDLRNWRVLRFPERAPHEGVAGLVQFLGLLVFVAIASTGTLLALYLEPGTRATGWLHGLKEVHEAAQVLIPAYLGLHVGGTAVHALLGQHFWREMFFIRAPR